MNQKLLPMKKVVLAIGVMICSLGAKAQQEVMVSQYMFNGLFLNPAYAGSHDFANATVLHRNQWVNFDGAPKSNLLAFDAPIANNTMGLGLLVINDNIGLMPSTDILANYSYHIKTSSKGKLSLGLRAGISNETFNRDGLLNVDINDPLYQGNQSFWVPKFGFGAYYYTDKFFAGLSIPTLAAFGGDNLREYTRHYFLNAGYVFNISNNIMFKPSTLIKYEASAPLQADINANFLFMNRVWLGASYRTGDAVVGILELQITPNFRLGYAYDATTTPIRNYSGGSHEIMLAYDFGRTITKVRNPRLF
jgi:type IX secretion system PorP/SprF family membrane protein